MTAETKESGAGAPQGAARYSAEERRRMIAEAAYFRAQARGFRAGDPVRDWLEAEREIDRRLAAELRRNEWAAYARLRVEVEKGLSRLGGKVDAEVIQQTIDRATARARKAGAHATESVNNAAERLRKEIAQATAAMGPRWEAFSDRTADVFAVWRDRSGVFLARAAAAVGEWLNQTTRRFESAPLRAGETVSAGSYACEQCGDMIVLEAVDTLPACPRCGHREYHRRQ